MKIKPYSVKITNGEQTYQERFAHLDKASAVFKFYVISCMQCEIWLTRIALLNGDCIMKEYNNLSAIREHKTCNF